MRSRTGSPIERTEDWKQWKSILKQAGIRDARIHDARHTAATLLIEQGAHIPGGSGDPPSHPSHDHRALQLRSDDAGERRERPHGRGALGPWLRANCNPEPCRDQKRPFPLNGEGPSICGGSGI
ncbi:tyrosine-type recombinase/integrase [Nonomuraea sp. NPDC050022]|uniref:tyrosine-type recombinase/integrase n=1 Tax=Nonomuraea sp. NPDC050022 TaxID=3364358 RepID=UPI0037B5E81A